MRNFADSQRASGIKRIIQQSLPLPEATFVRSDVIFGSPKLDCAGTGICKIMHAKSNVLFRRSAHCNVAPAILQRSPDGRHLYISIERSTVCALAYKLHLRSGILQITDACSIDPVLVHALELRFSSVIPGAYTIVEDDQIIRIQVQIG